MPRASGSIASVDSIRYLMIVVRSSVTRFPISWIQKPLSPEIRLFMRKHKKYNRNLDPTACSLDLSLRDKL
jgi:hypothetical protein